MPESLRRAWAVGANLQSQNRKNRGRAKAEPRGRRAPAQLQAQTSWRELSAQLLAQTGGACASSERAHQSTESMEKTMKCAPFRSTAALQEAARY